VSFPILTTPRLILTKIGEDDTKRLFELFSDKAVVKYYDLDAFETQAQATGLIQAFESRYEQELGIRWAIRLKGTNELIGTCGFNSWNVKMKNAVIGYDLMSAHWGRGITSEAVHYIVQAAFSGDLSCGKLHRIQADTVLGNIASESLLRKIGFIEEGIRRESGFWKNQFHDLKCFGLISTDYDKR